MDKLKESLRAFGSYLDNISDPKLDQMLAEIDTMGISGPSVEEYFTSVNSVVSSFFDEPSETSTIAEVESLLSDTRIDGTSNFGMPNYVVVEYFQPQWIEPYANCNAGEYPLPGEYPLCIAA